MDLVLLTHVVGGRVGGRRRESVNRYGLGFNFYAQGFMFMLPTSMSFFIDLHASIPSPTPLFSYYGFSSYARGFCIYAIDFCVCANLAFFYAAPSPAYAPWARWEGGAGSH